jgi:hypothetical protein
MPDALPDASAAAPTRHRALGLVVKRDGLRVNCVTSCNRGDVVHGARARAVGGLAIAGRTSIVLVQRLGRTQKVHRR